MKAALSLTGLATALSLTAVAAPAASRERHVKPADLHWIKPYGAKGPSFGFVEGALNDKHPASYFIMMAAGSDSGWHFHDGDYSAVVLQGSFTEQQQADSAETTLPSGSFFTQPAKQIHRNGCLTGTDCLVYVHFDGGANTTPTTRDGKPIKP